MDDELIMSGTRCDSTGFWHLDVSQPSPLPAADTSPVDPTENGFIKDFYANAAVGHARPADLVAFAHATMWSPSLSTLDKALLKGYITLPGLNSELLHKHTPNSRATAKGHLNQTRQGTNLTCATKPAALDETTPSTIDDEFEPAPLASDNEERTHECFAALIQPSGLVYTDQTGRFICPSESGNNYLMVMYDYDSDAILAEPVPNCNKKSLLAASKKMHAKLVAAGIRPKFQRLDNECSDIMKEFMQEQGIKFQLVLPNVHRRNAAERSIQTLKNHLVAGFCSLDENFPMYLWDKLLQHALLALNLLRGSRINPNLSAYAQLSTIPMASSADTILACLEQIVVCLQTPAAGSPLAPLDNTHAAALDNIRRLIVASTVNTPPPAPPQPSTAQPIPAAPTAPAPVLTTMTVPPTRVATQATIPTVETVPPPRVAAPTIAPPAPSPRVAATEQPTGSWPPHDAATAPGAQPYTNVQLPHTSLPTGAPTRTKITPTPIAPIARTQKLLSCIPSPNILPSLEVPSTQTQG
jgi:hypothetical protein